MSETTMLGKAIREGRLSRRDFMQRAAALGIGSIAATSMWGQSATAAPVKGGHLKVGISAGSVGDTLNPAALDSIFLYVAGWCVCNNLVELAPDKTPLPELAESWDVNAEATEWVFNLRQGIEFHNGKTFDADDVVYSINLHRGEDSTSAAKPLMAGVEDVVAETPHQVRITLSSPDAEFIYGLADFHMLMIPAGFEDWQNLVGTGGYTLDSWEDGIRGTFTRNPNYWKSDRAHVDTIELLSVTDTAARIAGIRSGELHVIDRVPASLTRQLEGTGTVNLVNTTSQSYFNSLMRTDIDPFVDNNLRLAFKYLLPRERMVETLLGGFGSVGNDHPVPSTDPFFHSELPQRPYDPDRAKFHLKEAGHDSFAVDMYASNAGHAEAVNAAILMQEAAEAGGVDINVVRVPEDGYWSDVWRNEPFCISTWGVRPTPGMMMNLAYRGGAPWNDTFFANTRFDGLLDSAKSETDFDSRKQIYWDLQEILYEEGGAGIFAFIDSIDAYSDKVAGVQSDSVRDLYGARVCERVWLDA